MRWIWIDSFVEFVPGQRASAIKNITQAEEYLSEHFPGFPIMPAALIIEGMAQTAGILVGEARGFTENVILAKIRSAEFDGYAVPGDQLRYDAVLEVIDERAAATTGTILKNGAALGRVDLMFSHVSQQNRERKSAEAVRSADALSDLPNHNFVFTEQFMQLLRGFQIRVGPQDASGE
jgi:3-hydroxyacyl-[acyl-carrier-protein] dehydratase